jgi:hypothetical protein
MRGAIIAASLAFATASSCVPKDLPMAELGDPERPDSVILYTGVRETVRRFADYGQIDHRILEHR